MSCYSAVRSDKALSKCEAIQGHLRPERHPIGGCLGRSGINPKYSQYHIVTLSRRESDALEEKFEINLVNSEA